jgi:hypothetical protein
MTYHLVKAPRRGKRIGDKRAEPEAEHFMACPNCGPPIDMRDLGPSARPC